MNQEQIKMGMKISKKISKKNAKKANNKHGNEEVNRKKDQSEIYREAVNLLGRYDHPRIESTRNLLNARYNKSRDEYINELNKWIIKCQEELKSDKNVKAIFDACNELLPKEAPNYVFNKETNQYELKSKNKEGILGAIGGGIKKLFSKKEDPKKEEIKELPEHDKIDEKLPEIKEASKPKVINSEYVNDLNDLHKEKKEEKKPEKIDYIIQETVQSLAKQLGSKFNEKYEHFENMVVAYISIIETRSVHKFNKWLDDNPDICNDNTVKDEIIPKFFEVFLNKLKDMGLNPIIDKGNGHITINNDTTAPKINSKPNLEAPATPTIPKNKKTEPKIEPEVKQTNPKVELKNKKRNNDELFKKYKISLTPNLFANNINQDMFVINLSKIINDGNYSNLLEQIRDVDAKYRGTGQKGKDQNGKAIKEIQQLMENNGFLDFNYQFEQFRRAFSDYRKNKLPKGFKKGDRLPFTEQKLRFDLDILIRSNFSLNGPGKIDRLKFINDELSRYGFPTISTAGVNNKTINFANYTEFEKNLRERSQGKIDTNPSNSKEFFSYDIHEIYNIIEKGLNNKLSTEAKNDIESIVKLETSNLINHANISHGASKIQNIIVEIENYLSSRMRKKSKTFKFTESNRYKLKELLSRFLNDKNGQK